MKIAVTSQNFRTVTGHAGKTRRFIVFDASLPCDPEETGRLDLPKELAMHEFTGGHHPLDDMDVILTASAGEGFIRKLSHRGVKVVVTGASDPRQAVRDFLFGQFAPPGEAADGHPQHHCGCGHPPKA